jgi:hypothetical protein
MAPMFKSTRARRESARRFAVALAIVAAVTGGGCNLFNNPDSPSTPSTATETFTGTIGTQGSVRSTFTFTVGQAGPVNVTLTTMTPSVAMGLGIGTPTGTTGCTMTSSNSSALAGSTPQLTVTLPSGPSCISLYDVGNLTSAATFTVTVSHP